jgi:hypothetical protein
MIETRSVAYFTLDSIKSPGADYSFKPLLMPLVIKSCCVATSAVIGDLLSGAIIGPCFTLDIILVLSFSAFGRNNDIAIFVKK